MTQILVSLINTCIVPLVRLKQEIAMTTTIKVVSITPDGSPQWVQDAWVGCELPVLVNKPVGACAEGFGDSQPAFVGTGYVVDADVALAVLEKRSPEAAAWMKVAVAKSGMPHLVFPVDDVRAIK